MKTSVCDKSEALALALEIEGLLLLLRERGEEVPEAEVSALLAEKSGRLARLLGGSEAEARAEAESAVFEEEAEADPEPEPEPAPEPESKPEPEPEPEPEPTRAETPAGSIRPLLSLNDMFRFRRELFGGSDAQLNDALDMVDAMTSLPEADDYFHTDLGWDRDEPVVKEFMALVARRFGIGGL